MGTRLQAPPAEARDGWQEHQVHFSMVPLTTVGPEPRSLEIFIAQADGSRAAAS
jgi:hypothetical protein